MAHQEMHPNTERMILRLLNEVRPANALARLLGSFWNDQESMRIAEVIVATGNEIDEFTSLSQLADAPGIDAVRFAELVPALTEIVNRESSKTVVIKFNDDFEIPYVDEAEQRLIEKDLEFWGSLTEHFPEISLSRLYITVTPEELTALVEEAVRLDPDYEPPNFLTYFTIEVSSQGDAEALVEAIASWTSVELAYVDPGPSVPPATGITGTNPLGDDQFHLFATSATAPPPAGINAVFAWGVSGGDGSGVQFVDIEKGWDLGHKDLTDSWNPTGYRSNIDRDGENSTMLSEIEHGTAALGIVVALDNDIGVIGIAPRTNVSVVSEERTSGNYSLPDAIAKAVTNTAIGDVILLEAQKGTLPVEVLDADYKAIRLATVLGRIVIEPAGNDVPTGTDLDSYAGGILDPASPNFQQSGAIMVAAARISNVPAPSYLIRSATSNYGSRIDCFGPGAGVVTTGGNANLHDPSDPVDDPPYTNQFDGTSAASAVVAGAAVVLQGIYRNSSPDPINLTPGQMKVMLGDESVNTNSKNGKSTDKIGVMPNLEGILTSGTIGPNVLPDIFIRDNLGDIGEPHTGSLSTSPDIIVSVNNLSTAAAQSAWGQPTGAVNATDLGYRVVGGVTNYVYVRAMNRRGQSVTGATVKVFWSEVGSLVMPDQWHPIGESTIPLIDVGVVPISDLMVSGAIPWDPGDMPALGQHACMIGIIGSTLDPAPYPLKDRLPSDLNDLDQFYRFVRDHNNVAWRNFNVVAAAAGSSSPSAMPAIIDPVPLPFKIRGPQDVDTPMRIEVFAALPEGSSISLETDEDLLRKSEARFRIRNINGPLTTRVVSLSPHGLTSLGEILIPKGTDADSKLHVYIPPEHINGEYEVYARQVYKDFEVGRVTWQLVSPQRKKEIEGQVEIRPRRGFLGKLVNWWCRLLLRVCCRGRL